MEQIGKAIGIGRTSVYKLSKALKNLEYWNIREEKAMESGL